jgi:hypothetical protein
MSKIILVSLLTRVKTILRLAECPVIAIPEVLASVEVVDSLAFRLFTVYVDVLLLCRLLRNQRRCLVGTRHVVSLEDARCAIRVVAAA